VRISSLGVIWLRTSSRNVEKMHGFSCAYGDPAFPAAGYLFSRHFQHNTREDQPAKVSDGFGQKVYDEGYFKVISSVW
jgi:hypothetical protein